MSAMNQVQLTPAVAPQVASEGRRIQRSGVVAESRDESLEVVDFLRVVDIRRRAKVCRDVDAFGHSARFDHALDKKRSEHADIPRRPWAGETVQRTTNEYAHVMANLAETP